MVKHDLQLLAQISSSSEEGYFKSFLHNLLELFSTDRSLLNHRGSLIIRQLCVNLNTERIYKTLAEILEKEEVRIYSHARRKFLNSRIGFGVCERNGAETEHYPHHISRIS